MTQPQAPVTQAPRGSYTFTLSVRTVFSVVETAGAIAATVLAALNNGSDTHNALITALVAFIAHGVNHPAGSSPV